MGFGLLVYSRVFAGLWRKWLLLSIPPTVMMIVLFLVTPTPFGHLFDLLTIDSSTAYFRLYIWNSVGPAILENPFFSVPDSLYEYHSSVDSLWLALSLSYGMPCAILVALSMIGCCSLPTNRPRAQLSSEEEKLGTALGIIIFLIIFMAFTVHFWGPLWILIGLLLGMRAHLGELGRLNLARDRTYTSNF
jgi:O-antigen ligase